MVTSFYEDVTPAARAWTDHFMAQSRKIPTEVQVGVYSAVRHMLQAVKDTDSDNGDIVAARMHATPMSDAYASQGTIRPDGRLSHDIYLMQVKTPKQSKDPHCNDPGGAGVPAAVSQPMPPGASG